MGPYAYEEIKRKKSKQPQGGNQDVGGVLPKNPATKVWGEDNNVMSPGSRGENTA